jgi:tetrahydromethanopterin S-methyltransferase subunit G
MLSKAVDTGELKSRLDDIDKKNEDARLARSKAKGKKK